MPTYNRAELLDHTLSSLAGQDLGQDRYQVIVVDDGSGDDSEEVVCRYAKDLDVSYHFQPDEGYRVAAARNVGIWHATGEVCLFVDSGVILHSTAVAAHLARHESSAEPLAVVGYVYCFNQDNEDADAIRARVNPRDPDRSIDELNRDGLWIDYRERVYRKHADRLDDLPAPWFLYWTCNVSARTAQLRSIGGFDENFRCWGGEDIDLGYRLHRDGARFVVERTATSIHYPHEKHYESHARDAIGNYQYIAAKYDTPITRLLHAVPSANFLDVNDQIIAADLPRCADYLAGRSRAATDATA